MIDHELTRRRFLARVGGQAAAAAIVGGWLGACARGGQSDRRSESERPSARGTARTERAVGIQLYSVRSLMARDPDGTLAALAGLGYAEVELAGLGGRTAREIRAMLDRHGLVAPAGHVSLPELRDSMSGVLDDAATLGWKWIVCPWIDRADRTVDGYRRVASQLARAAASARARGIGLAYHNHEFEFEPLPDGTLPYDLLLAETDPALVRMELDLFWIAKGGQDPLRYFAAHPGRFPLVHVKDMNAAGGMVDVGDGTLDFRRIFARAGQAGIEHYFVEHDDPRDPMETARRSLGAMARILDT